MSTSKRTASNYIGLGFGPGGGAEDAVAVATVGVGGDLHHFLQQVIEGGGVEAQLDEVAVVHDQVIFNGLVAWVGQIVDLSAGESGHLWPVHPPDDFRSFG